LKDSTAKDLEQSQVDTKKANDDINRKIAALKAGSSSAPSGPASSAGQGHRRPLQLHAHQLMPSLLQYLCQHDFG
jgi:hypothetical protein